MRTSNTMLTLLALCCYWSGSGATVLNYLQYGTGAAATYAWTLNPVGTLVTAGIGGAAALGAIAGLAAASRRNSGRTIYRRRYGRSLPEAPGATELILEIVEALDNNGCAKRLLCEEAAREAQLGDQLDAASPPQEEDYAYLGDAAPSEDVKDATQDFDLDETSSMMLQFIKGGRIHAINVQSSRVKMMSVIDAGMNGKDCASLFPSCKFNRKQILEDLRRARIL